MDAYVQILLAGTLNIKIIWEKLQLKCDESKSEKGKVSVEEDVLDSISVNLVKCSY
jgi:hypothetical protein